LQPAHPLRQALPLLLASGFFFATLDTTGKFLVGTHAVLLVVWARYLGQALFATAAASHRLGRRFWQSRHLRVQLVRALCLVVASASFVASLRYLPLAEGAAIAFLAPMFAIVLSIPVLGERPTRVRWLAAVGGFGGILLIVRPGTAVFQPAAALMAFSALANALYQLLTRRVPQDRPETTLFYTSSVGVVALTLLLPLIEFPATVTPREMALFASLGLLAGLGHWCFIAAFVRAPASLLAPFTYVHLVWATLYGWLVFGTLPDGIAVAGMGVIIASGVLLALHERRRTQ
jgi:drug/metabolite transporter (DMT)-like permease